MYPKIQPPFVLHKGTSTAAPQQQTTPAFALQTQGLSLSQLLTCICFIHRHKLTKRDELLDSSFGKSATMEINTHLSSLLPLLPSPCPGLAAYRTCPNQRFLLEPSDVHLVAGRRVLNRETRAGWSTERQR